MISYRRGDVVLVGFIFTDESGVKQRPAIVISSDIYCQQRREVIISAVTSQTERLLAGENMTGNFHRMWNTISRMAASTAKEVKGI